MIYIIYSEFNVTNYENIKDGILNHKIIENVKANHVTHGVVIEII
jgi:hypothetical protein